jgi:hypothetical protein
MGRCFRVGLREACNLFTLALAGTQVPGSARECQGVAALVAAPQDLCTITRSFSFDLRLHLGYNNGGIVGRWQNVDAIFLSAFVRGNLRPIFGRLAWD